MNIPQEAKALWRRLDPGGALRLYHMVYVAEQLYNKMAYDFRRSKWVKQQCTDLPEPKRLGVYGKTFLARIIIRSSDHCFAISIAWQLLELS